MNKMNYGKRRISCGVCLEDGHNRRSCPNIESLYEEYKEVASGTLPNPHGRKAWLIRAAAFEMERRENKKPKKPRKRKKSRCSFCKKPGHNRRNCTEFPKVRDRFMKANVSWKRKFAESLKKSGYGVGALVMVAHYRQWTGMGWEEGSNMPAVIKAIPFDELNLMCSFEGQFDYKTNVGLDLLVTNGNNITFKENSNVWHFITEKRGLFKMQWRYDSQPLLELLSPAAPVIPEGWTEEDDESIDWLLKNHSKEELQDRGITQVVNKWFKEQK
jgi:hypothetical protein